MKTFSKHWKASKNPSKQRKYTAKAPLHTKRKLLSVNLSKELRKKYERRNIEIRKGDKVKIMRGKYKGKIKKVSEVKTKRLKIYLEGIQIKKIEGSKVNVALRPSNLQIIELNIDDKKRMKNNKKISKEEKVSGTKSQDSSLKQERKGNKK